MDSSIYIPITDVIVVSDCNKIPYGYISIGYTTPGKSTADIGYENFFTRENRFIAFARHSSNGKATLWVSDLKFTDKDSAIIPGYTAIEETNDSRKPAFKKHRLSVKKTQPENLDEDVIVDIKLMTTKEHKNQNQSLPQNFYRVGEVNQIIIFALKLPRRMAVTRPPANTQPHPQPQPKPKPQFQQSPSQTNLAQTSTMPYTNGSPSRQNPIYQRAPSLQKDPLTGVSFRVIPNAASASEKVKAVLAATRVDVNPLRLRQFIDGQAEYNFNMEYTAQREQSPK